MIDREQLVELLFRRRTDQIFVLTNSPVKEWANYPPNDLDIFVGGCMGYVPSISLGLALAQPNRKVVALDGDGSLLMNLGTLVTLANYGPANLVYCVLENGAYELSGPAPLPGKGTVSLVDIAKGAGVKRVHVFDDLSEVSECLGGLLSEPGPMFISFRMRAGASEPGKMIQAAKTSMERIRNLERALSS